MKKVTLLALLVGMTYVPNIFSAYLPTLPGRVKTTVVNLTPHKCRGYFYKKGKRPSYEKANWKTFNYYQKTIVQRKKNHTMFYVELDRKPKDVFVTTSLITIQENTNKINVNLIENPHAALGLKDLEATY